MRISDWSSDVCSSDLTGALTAAMAKGEVAVIPGFQGMMDDGRVATLGRGGSDTSAVAVAAAVKADRCDIYTDVDGVYTRSEEHTSELQSLMRLSYAVFCLKKKTNNSQSMTRLKTIK